MNKPVIVWDVDDVLNDLTKQWLKYSGFAQRINYTELTANPPHEKLGLKLSDYLQSLDEFRQRELSCLKPVPEVYAWFEKHASNYINIALTAVPFKFSHLSAQWVMQNYGRWVRTFHFVPSPRPDDEHTEYDTKKSQFMQRLTKVDLFIDDSEKNLNDAKEAGFKCLEFPRPWNRSGSISIPDFLDKVTKELQ